MPKYATMLGRAAALVKLGLAVPFESPHSRREYRGRRQGVDYAGKTLGLLGGAALGGILGHRYGGLAGAALGSVGAGTLGSYVAPVPLHAIHDAITEKDNRLDLQYNSTLARLNAAGGFPTETPPLPPGY